METQYAEREKWGKRDPPPPRVRVRKGRVEGLRVWSRREGGKGRGGAEKVGSRRGGRAFRGKMELRKREPRPLLRRIKGPLVSPRCPYSLGGSGG